MNRYVVYGKHKILTGCNAFYVVYTKIPDDILEYVSSGKLLPTSYIEKLFSDNDDILLELRDFNDYTWTIA